MENIVSCMVTYGEMITLMSKDVPLSPEKSDAVLSILGVSAKDAMHVRIRSMRDITTTIFQNGSRDVIRSSMTMQTHGRKKGAFKIILDAALSPVRLADYVGGATFTAGEVAGDNAFEFGKRLVSGGDDGKA